MTVQFDVESAKRSNIIEIAVAFSAMMRLFSKGSTASIQAKLEKCFAGLREISTRSEYEAVHQSFCEWFTRGVTTAAKKSKNGIVVKQSGSASYGQAAKVLDIAIKVYVYYCGQPDVETASRLLPFLNGAVDTPIMEHLKTRYPSAAIRAKTIQAIDEKTYQAIQVLVCRDINDSFGGKIHPVQYDDVMFRKLNRGPALLNAGPVG